VKSNEKVAVGLSGGVDSSVAAHLLKKQGYQVTGVYIKCWEEEPGCGGSEDKMYAVQSAAHLNIKFKELNLMKEYNDKVLSYFYNEYQAGRTPNPDIVCNKEIKFGLFFEWAIKNGFDYVATGHYARTKKTGNKYNLLTGVDESKDQSYFLYLLTQKHLKKTLFPVGELRKAEIRKIAKEVNLPTKDRPDSVGICFIGKVDVKDFLKKKIKPKKGEVVTQEGKVIGEHEGAWFYTVGQRRGFKLTKYQGTPLFVISKDIKKNRLVVGVRDECLVKKLTVTDYHSPTDTKASGELLVRIRHLGEFHKGNVTLPKVVLNKPVFGVAPGQSAVFYDGDVVLGGGVIETSFSNPRLDLEQSIKNH